MGDSSNSWFQFALAPAQINQDYARHHLSPLLTALRQPASSYQPSLWARFDGGLRRQNIMATYAALFAAFVSASAASIADELFSTSPQPNLPDFCAPFQEPPNIPAPAPLDRLKHLEPG